MHSENCFITLTYGDQAPPLSLRYRDFQAFMKRLRTAHRGTKIRFYACGEYGELHRRPHFHACLFGINFPDRVSHGGKLSFSPSLDRLWTHGVCSIGELTFESAAYVARYVCKKITGDLAEPHYQAVDPDTGEIVSLTPEFARMSLRPGIGASWLRRFGGDVYNPALLGQILNVRGHESSAPRYYNKLMKSELIMDDVEFKRHQDAVARSSDNTPARLLVKEKVAKSKYRSLPRPL